MKTHNFTARASECGKIGPGAHTPCNLLSITEIFFTLERLFKKYELNLAIRKCTCRKNRYDMDYAFYFSLSTILQVNKVIFRGC